LTVRRPAAATVAIVAALSAFGLVVAGCGSGAAAQGDEACQYVHSSISEYSASVQAGRSGDGAKARKDASSALTDLRLALPLAAQAAGSDGDWQPLMADLSESNRVPERNLIPGLTAQCAGIS
jgi:hypothetical protein